MRFVGKTLRFRYESGLEVKAHYPSATELVWEALSGPVKGKKASETIQAVEVAPEVFFISWLEKEGTSVSNVLDLSSMRMFAFVTHDGGTARAGRASSTAVRSKSSTSKLPSG